MLHLKDVLNEGNPGLNLGEDAVETLETAFRRMRELLLGIFLSFLINLL